MPFLGEDCHQRGFVDDDGGSYTKCARLIVRASRVDPSIPVCSQPCPIPPATGSKRLALHEDCLMSLTTQEALRSDLRRRVLEVLYY